MGWEVRVDRAEQVTKKNTDQWIQRDGSVRLAALWLCGRRHEDMEPGAELNEAWNPMLEANPVQTPAPMPAIAAAPPVLALPVPSSQGDLPALTDSTTAQQAVPALHSGDLVEGVPSVQPDINAIEHAARLSSGDGPTERVSSASPNHTIAETSVSPPVGSNPLEPASTVPPSTPMPPNSEAVESTSQAPLAIDTFEMPVSTPPRNNRVRAGAAVPQSSNKVDIKSASPSTSELDVSPNNNHVAHDDPYMQVSSSPDQLSEVSPNSIPAETEPVPIEESVGRAVETNTVLQSPESGIYSL